MHLLQGPNSNNYINIHTHRKAMVHNEWILRNAFHSLGADQIKELDYAISIGVHPWYAAKGGITATQLEAPNVMAIGEIGLDRVIFTDFDLQRSVFEAQLLLAEQYNLPVIIHSVRSNADLLPYLKRSSVPWIFHHYNGSLQQAQQIIAQGAWLSFGQGLFRSEKIREVFIAIPRNKLFLETDNSTYRIDEVYNKAAMLLNSTVDELKQQVFYNFASVFK